MTRLVDWDRRALRAGADAVLDVYAEAMGVPRLLAAARRSILVAHLERANRRGRPVRVVDLPVVPGAMGRRRWPVPEVPDLPALADLLELGPRG